MNCILKVWTCQGPRSTSTLPLDRDPGSLGIRLCPCAWTSPRPLTPTTTQGAKLCPSLGRGIVDYGHPQDACLESQGVDSRSVVRQPSREAPKRGRALYCLMLPPSQLGLTVVRHAVSKAFYSFRRFLFIVPPAPVPTSSTPPRSQKRPHHFYPVLDLSPWSSVILLGSPVASPVRR